MTTPLTPGTGCELAHLDGAYVLGSLSTSERTAYERHLPGCDECSRAVRDLAGLPGLMSRVPLEVVEPPGEREPVPETLLPALVAEARRSRRRRRTTLLAVVAAAAAVAVVGGIGAVAVTLGGEEEAPPAAAPSATETTAEPLRMDAVGAGGVSGWVSLTERPWGTRLDLTCTYVASGYGGDGTTSYAMRVRTADGSVEQVGTWRAETGRQVHVTMATDAVPDEIATVVVTTADGAPVLRLRTR